MYFLILTHIATTVPGGLATAPEVAMAANRTPEQHQLISMVFRGMQESLKPYLVVILAILATILLARIGPSLHPQEPKILKPTIPFVGHIINLIRRQGLFVSSLCNQTVDSIATLPMLNRKVYAVWDPALLQAVFRNKDLTLLHFAKLAKQETGLNDLTMQTILVGDHLPELFDIIHRSLTGTHLHEMSKVALDCISAQLGKQITSDRTWTEIPNMYFWIRELVTLATTESLFGIHNPFKNDASLLDDIWTFDTGFLYFLLDIYPRWTMPRAYRARNRIQTALIHYYAARHDTDRSASELMRARAAAIRGYGVPDDELGRLELGLMHAAVANTAPALFWLVAHVFSDAELAVRLREEMEAAVDRNGDVVVVDITALEKRCPRLVACHRENLRLRAVAPVSRHVERDTTVTDGAGNRFLLKEGVDVLASVRYSQRSLERVWGADAGEFRPERFLEQKAGDVPEVEKARRAAYHPFGGGKHLCPGRNLVYAEILGMVGMLVLGFDVVPLQQDGEWELPPPAKIVLSEGITKPARDGDGFGMRIRRREGWERVRWEFKC